MITMPGFLFFFFLFCFTFLFFLNPFYALEKEGEEKEKKISYKCCDLHFFCVKDAFMYFFIHLCDYFLRLFFLKLNFGLQAMKRPAQGQ